MTTRIQFAFDRYAAGDLAAAERACRQALVEDDQLADGWLLLGVLAEHAKVPADAERFLQRAAQLAPQDLRVWNTLGTFLDGAGRLDDAIAAYGKALALRPDYAPALQNLAEVYRTLGRHHDALAHYERALQADPTLDAAHHNRLFTMHFESSLDDAAIWQAHRQWGEWMAASVTPLPAAETSPDPDRTLVIGYLSPDFREHAVARFFEPLLAAHDRSRNRIVLYSECPVVDAVGARLRGYGDTWRIVRGQSAETVAKQVRADGVDILIDLAGHTRDNRLDVLACKPAPVQATFLGYPYSTGLPRIDYRITDTVLDPLDAPARTGLGESLLRLPPGVCCFRMPDAMPPTSPLPLAATGRLTFGCHHPLTKLNKPLLTLWARIAEALPSARFLAIRSNWDPTSIREARALMASAGLEPDRVEIRKTTIAPGDYLAGFHEMDVVLDAVPFNGHTMTCEALAMGVPVLTLRGDRPAGRLSASVLSALGMTEFIAETPDDYVAKAVALPDQVAHLVEVRATLRDRVGTVLGDGTRYGRALESGLRDAWRTWCRSR